MGKDEDPTAYEISNKQELYTPKPYVSAVRAVLGGRINLDPASCVAANGIVGADYFYTKEDDGLALPWTLPGGGPATVFNNPPYGKYQDHEDKTRFNLVSWTAKFIEEWQAGNMSIGIQLVNSQAGASWYHRMLEHLPVCQVKGRIPFIDGATMEPQTQPRWYSSFFYAGPDISVFYEHFHQFGTVLVNCDSIILNSFYAFTS